MNDAEFTTRVHECLDARADPLDDQAVCAFLAAHPQHLAAFADLRARLAQVASMRGAARPAPATVQHAQARRIRWPSLAGIAVAAGLALLVPGTLVRGDGTAPPTTGGSSRVLATSLTELRPRAWAAATFEVRQTLLTTASTRVSVCERRSEPR